MATNTPLATTLGLIFALGLALARAQFDLPNGANDIIKELPINDTFTCEDREYGYYGDIANNCQLFHVCLPIEDNFGEIVEFKQWTFLCSNGTMFDQQTLSCNFPSDSYPCELSEDLYGTVQFGVVEDVLKKIKRL